MDIFLDMHTQCLESLFDEACGMDSALESKGSNSKIKMIINAGINMIKALFRKIALLLVAFANLFRKNKFMYMPDEAAKILKKGIGLVRHWTTKMNEIPSINLLLNRANNDFDFTLTGLREYEHYDVDILRDSNEFAQLSNNADHNYLASDGKFSYGGTMVKYDGFTADSKALTDAANKFVKMSNDTTKLAEELTKYEDEMYTDENYWNKSAEERMKIDKGGYKKAGVDSDSNAGAHFITQYFRMMRNNSGAMLKLIQQVQIVYNNTVYAAKKSGFRGKVPPQNEVQSSQSYAVRYGKMEDL